MATKKVKVLAVVVSALVSLLEGLGIAKAGEWFKGNRWKKKLGEGLENIPALADAAGDKVEKLDEEGMDLLKSILAALESEQPINVVMEDEEEEEEADEEEEEADEEEEEADEEEEEDDEEEEEADEEEEEADEEEEEADEEEEEDDEEEEEADEEEEEEAPVPKKGKKAAAAKTPAAPAKKTKGKKPVAGDFVHVANSQEDDEWDGKLLSIDDEESGACTVADSAGKEWWEPLTALTKIDEPKGFGKKAAKKGGAKKGGGSPIKKAEGKVKGVGVIGSIVEFLTKATAKKPLTKQDIVAKLADRFPDRAEESLAGTVGVQVPNRINKERDGCVVKKNDKSPAGYWIESES